MVSFMDLFIKFGIIGIVVVSMFSLIIGFQLENDISDRFIEDPVINETYGELIQDLGDERDTAQSQKTLFEEENPTSGFGSILLFSIVSSGKVFNSMIVGTFNTLIKLPVVFLGLDPIVVSVLGTLLLIFIIIGLWRLYKLGG